MGPFSIGIGLFQAPLHRPHSPTEPAFMSSTGASDEISSTGSRFSSARGSKKTGSKPPSSVSRTVDDDASTSSPSPRPMNL